MSKIENSKPPVNKNMNEFYKLKEAIRKLFQDLLFPNYESELKLIRDKVKTIDNLIKERTSLHMDLHLSKRRSPDQVVMIGRYFNRDYVRIFEIKSDDFKDLIPRLIEIEKRYGKIRGIDAPYGMEAVIKNELVRSKKNSLFI